MPPLRLFAIAVLTDLLKEFSDSIRTILASGGHLGGQPRLERRRLLLDEPEDFLQRVLVVHDSGAFALADCGVALLRSLERFSARKRASFHGSPSIHSSSSKAHHLKWRNAHLSGFMSLLNPRSDNWGNPRSLREQALSLEWVLSRWRCFADYATQTAVESLPLAGIVIPFPKASSVNFDRYRTVIEFVSSERPSSAPVSFAPQSGGGYGRVSPQPDAHPAFP